MNIEHHDILIIGAGPAGSVAAGLLRQLGHKVLIVERETFPRFSIGESLLPQSMEFIEQAGMLQAVVEHGFQFKNGASFVRGEYHTDFDFRDKHSSGWGTTYQVPRADFDHILACEAQRQGTEIRYRHRVLEADFSGTQPVVRIADESEPQPRPYVVHARFVLDASGFGRVLPRLLNLERPSGFPLRTAHFTHIQDGIAAGSFDRNKIRITVHPKHHDVWYWLIPFSNGRSSVGVVAEDTFIQHLDGDETQKLQALVHDDPSLHALLGQAVWDTPARKLTGYAANVVSLYGPGYALLGNAGEFLDPIFSSGVTIAMKSASLACDAVHRTLQGEVVDWEATYARPLKRGVDTFRTFVESWYAGGFQDVIFHERQETQIRRMISSILAGYAWDISNPFVAESKRRLTALEAICAT
ncbi:NAD(P)/FAD-dependent oxidoreductase [Herbaspirillum chlorophenolicum]|uniref:NAD(P)/FAD-dependent oxidoreductase n=1 Tax=Herbaspirillum chlorophenolicum TaxID=211589 RepID=A0ABW8EYP5_9BURK